MKRIFWLVVFAAAFWCAFASTEGRMNERTVVTVDQNNQLNVSGIASVTEVATNAVKAQVAEAKAEAARSTAGGVTNALNEIVGSIMEGNQVIYRYGYADSFSSLVIFGDSDKLIISDVQQSIDGTTLTVVIRYVCTVDIGTLKPVVYANSQLDGGKDNFPVVEDANVTSPVYHAGEVVIGKGDDALRFSGYYEITATIPNLTSGAQYFFWIKVDPDTPSGDGMSLELPNGVVGGASTIVNWGSKRLTFEKGMLVRVEENAN